MIENITPSDAKAPKNVSRRTFFGNFHDLLLHWYTLLRIKM